MSRPILLKTLGEEQRYPYFLKNDIIGEDTYIVQKAYSIPHALYIIDVWNREKYNVGEIDRVLGSSLEEFSYTKYLYNNNMNISKVEINGGDESFKVLLYKKEGKVYTSALLKFDTHS